MKAIVFALAMVLSTSAFANMGPSRPFTCIGGDEHHTGVKVRISGNVAEKDAYGRTFLVGDFTFEIKEPKKPLYVATLKLSIDERENVQIIGKEPVIKNGTWMDGSSIFDLGPLAMGGNFGYSSPDGSAAYKLEVSCKGLF